MNAEIDVRHALPAIRVPTLVLHRVGDEDVVPECGQYLADHIPGAQYQPLDGIDHSWWIESYQISGAARPFLEGLWASGTWGHSEPDRVLATLLFTDIVGSTAMLADLGDRRWGEVLAEHHRLVRGALARFNGQEIDTAGDGFFASFDGPARAIRCAEAIVDGVRDLGLDVRAGLHTGECELVDGKVGGIAVHIGARVAAQAGPGEVLVSGTVRDLVAGSGIRFTERGSAQLKGVPGVWNLFAVDRGRES
jgi:class 3 adenylate cyclase